MTEQNLTYLDMCQVIANEMYDSAEAGNLIGLLLVDSMCAKIFWKIINN